ncbi:MAG: methyltransferase domain-containing protein [Verrucomicrobiales bacterium]|nr:methyltransferase domain-containing protein [Verrucomicrobiales bacterium]
MSHHASFLKAFARNSSQVGAIVPSSDQLAGLMIDWLDWDSIDCIIEYGPGTGVFTEAISKCISPGTTFFAIERDPELAGITRQRCPEVKVIEACVSEVAALCQAEGREKVDAVICGLPWAAFSPELQDKCLEAMFEVLPPGGKFATFAYWQGLLLPAGQRFRKFLKTNFSSVEQSPTAWKNLPPAFVYRCER